MLQRLQKEGLFNFKNVPAKKQVSKPKMIMKKPPIAIAADVAYGDFKQTTSFVDDKANPSSPNL